MSVQFLENVFGQMVRLTLKRRWHLLEHPEMVGIESEIGRILLHPEIVRRSRSDDSVLLYYGFLERTSVGSKWLCVVVKYGETDAFIVTAYLTDKVKAGEGLWPQR